jgi:hypothetical protein
MFIASLLLVGWHRATVLHGHCLEHDESIELIAASGSSHAIAADTGETVLQSADWTQLGDDEHCEVLALAHVPLTTATPLALHHVMVATEVAPQPLVIPARRAAPLYHLAPKTSPPLHA